MADSDSTTPLQLGTRVRTTIRSTRELFRRSYDSPPNIEIVPAGATGRIVGTQLSGNEVLYNIQLELVDTNINQTRAEWIEVIGDDHPAEGRIVHVADLSVANDISQLSSHYPEVDISSHILEKTEIYQSDDGLYCLRWKPDYQAIVDSLRGR